MELTRFVDNRAWTMTPPKSTSTTFAHQCGIQDAAREAAAQQCAALITASGIQTVRFAWCDLHGMLRVKTLMASAAVKALSCGVGMVGTLLLKDSADRTAYPVFDADGASQLPSFAFGSNVMLLPDPSSFKILPWLEKTGWLQCQSWFADATPVGFDTRRVLQTALAQLADAGYAMICGLEIEFHIYKINANGARHQLDPLQASWPGLVPEVSLIHPGHHLLSDQWADLADEPLAIVRRCAQGLGLPLMSLEIEFGPSQVEAVFEPVDALAAADNMVLFRSSVKQALRRAGYHATFMCRPPFAQIMSSGWHLHQSLVHLSAQQNAFMRAAPAAHTAMQDASYTLSSCGEHYLAGLLAHARGMTAICAPTLNAYGRFGANALAPQAAVWGRDNRGAMLRVIGAAGDAATRIENRIGEPAANPYVYIASQIYAGLSGIRQQLAAPQATDSPYQSAAPLLPTNLGQALDALGADSKLCAAFGPEFIAYFDRIKRAEIARCFEFGDTAEWERREYFGRI